MFWFALLMIAEKTEEMPHFFARPMQGRNAQKTAEYAHYSHL